jgi:hypothetical protein
VTPYEALFFSEKKRDERDEFPYGSNLRFLAMMMSVEIDRFQEGLIKNSISIGYFTCMYVI